MSATFQTTQRVLQRDEMDFTAEARDIQDSAGQEIVKVVRLGQLTFFSAASGDAWMLDPEEGLAAPLARGGDPCPIPIEETATTMGIQWDMKYRIEGEAFVVTDRSGGQIRTILGYPTAEIIRMNQAYPSIPRVAGPAVETAREHLKTGTNQPCPCGSGRKYKNCCRAKDLDLVNKAAAAATVVRAQSLDEAQEEAVDREEDAAEDWDEGDGATFANADGDEGVVSDDDEDDESDAEMERRDEIWDAFEALESPTRAQMDAVVEDLLALPPDLTDWYEVLHAVAGHPDLPGVFRRIAAAVPHGKDSGMDYFYWSAGDEFVAHGFEVLLPEVAARFCKMDDVSTEALEHLEEILLGAGYEEDALHLAEHFLSQHVRGSRHMPGADEQREWVFELRAGRAAQNPPAAGVSVQEMTQRLTEGMGEDADVRTEYVEPCAAVICGLQPDPVWSRADFEMKAKGWAEDYPRLYAIMLRVAREEARESGVSAGKSFRGLSRLLHAVHEEREQDEEKVLKLAKVKGDSRVRGKGGRKGGGQGSLRQSIPLNILDYMEVPRIDPRLVEGSRDLVGIDRSKARVLLDAHDDLLRFALRHGLMPAAEVAACQAEVARIRDVVTTVGIKEQASG